MNAEHVLAFVKDCQYLFSKNNIALRVENIKKMMGQVAFSMILDDNHLQHQL